MLVDKQVRMAIARDANHAVIEIFDPAVDRLTVSQLHGDTDVTITERTEIERLLPSIARRRSSGTAQMRWWGRSHDLIVLGRGGTCIGCTNRRSGLAHHRRMVNAAVRKRSIGRLRVGVVARPKAYVKSAVRRSRHRHADPMKADSGRLFRRIVTEHILRSQIF